MNADSDTSLISPVSEETDISVASANVCIDISSSTSLELTVTKASLEVFDQLSTSFASAIKSLGVKETGITAPYLVKNTTGAPVTIILSNTPYNLHAQNGEDPNEIVLENNAEVALELKPEFETKKDMRKDIFNRQFVHEASLRVKVYLVVIIFFFIILIQ